MENSFNSARLGIVVILLFLILGGCSIGVFRPSVSDPILIKCLYGGGPDAPFLTTLEIRPNGISLQRFGNRRMNRSIVEKEFHAILREFEAVLMLEPFPAPEAGSWEQIWVGYENTVFGVSARRIPDQVAAILMLVEAMFIRRFGNT